MDPAVKEPGDVVVTDSRGTSYKVSSASFYETQENGALFSVRENDFLVLKRLPTRLLSADKEKRLRSIISKEKNLWPILARQISLVFDLAYEQGEWVGYFLTFMRMGESLEDFLVSANGNVAVRMRVAKNLCTLVILAKDKNINLGRLTPSCIRIDSKNCRVFLCRSAVRGFDARIVTEEPYDLLLHVYALARGGSAKKTENLSWDNDDLNGGRQKRTTWQRISENIRNGSNRPLVVRAIARLPFGASFRSCFWNEPARLRRVYEKYTSRRIARSMQEVAAELLACLNASADEDDFFSRLLKRAGRICSGGNVDREALKDNERLVNGSRGNGNGKTFWFITLLTSVGVGVCAVVNGFSPFEVLVHSNESGVPPATIEGAAWQYVSAAIGGCVAFNVFLAHGDRVRGYTRASYCGSLTMAVIFMALTKFLGVWLGGLTWG